MAEKTPPTPRVNTEEARDADGAKRVTVKESLKPFGTGVMLETRDGDKTYRVTAATEADARRFLTENRDACLVREEKE